jgi:hypothetical protein
MATSLNATVWRVNNRPYFDADYTTLQAAIDGASSGDTLYIEASPTAYGNGTFDKQLVVIGAGYWLAENDTTQAYTEYSRVGKLIFNAGSEGSEIRGLYIYYTSNSSFNLVEINVNNITIVKNYIFPYKITQTSNAYGIIIIGDKANITIKQNWINARVHTDVNPCYVYCIYFTGIPTSCTINNNFLRAYSTLNGGYYAIAMGSNNLTNDLIINNNVMWGSVVTYHTFLVNNILVSGSYNNSVDDQTSNNLCNGTQFPDINNNQQNVDMSTVFVDYVGYIDNDYILPTGSPAKNAGVNGGDCGVFSYDYGSIPYVLSGMPEIPAIFEATATATVGTTSLPINIKASSHNEHK